VRLMTPVAVCIAPTLIFSFSLRFTSYQRIAAIPRTACYRSLHLSCLFLTQVLCASVLVKSGL
jgi:hypothetical protein